MINKYKRLFEPRGLPQTVVNAALAVVGLCIFATALLSQVKAPGAAAGRDLFEKRCGGCHALDEDHEGPRLKGVVGRTAGSVKTFKYSAPLQNAGFKWDEAKLDKWLTDTESLVPENDMAFRVPKPEERTAIIAYLKSLSSH